MQSGTDSKVFFYSKKNNLILPGDQVLLAFSGGADSLYLLYFLIELQKHIAFSLEAMHIHHGIREEEAERDLEFAKKRAADWNVPFSFVKVDVPRYSKEEGKGLEEGARILRYGALEKRRTEWEREGGRVTKLALAQHMDDQAETVVHHLIRGSGFSGLSAMRKEEGLYIRPLLCLRKKEIKERLSELSLSYVEDSTNEDFSYTRNFIRKKIIPLMELVNGRAVEHLFGEAELMAEVEEYFFRKAEAFIEAHGKKAEAEISFSLKPLKKEDALVRREIYRLALRILEGNIINLSKAHLYALDSLIFSGNGKRTELPGGYLGLIKEKKLYFIKAE